MASKISYLISTKKLGKGGVNEGKCEVVLKVYLTRTLRVQVKSGVFILPKYFDGEELQSRPQTFVSPVGIKPPHMSKHNLIERAEVMKAQERLEGFAALASKVAHEMQIARATPTREEFTSLLDAASKHGITAERATLSILQELREVEAKPCEVSKQRSIYELGQAYIDKKDFATDHYKAHKVLFRTMARYELFRKAIDKADTFCWDLQDICREDIEDFADYLADEAALADEHKNIFAKIIPAAVELCGQAGSKVNGISERGGNSIVKLLKKLKAFFAWLRKEGYTEARPFEGVEIGSEKYGTPFYLTKEERNIIATHDLSARPALEVQRDIFIFQCLIGCRVSDLIKLTADNITDGILEYVPHKTKDNEIPVQPRIPLNEQALALIEKYKGKDEQGRLFPFVSPQKYNDDIKKIFTAAGVTRIVQVRNALTGETEQRPINEVASSHLARRTFVGVLYKQVKDPNLIGKMSGHVEGSRAFARYRDIDDDDLRNVIALID